ncbi:calcineurin catalytic subunit A, putative [Entamoeba histolytica HM-1:IMSS-B]|uniref:Serine/threonine-protein phosphatase n=1 Tax=Entamoeba histolytica HM-1:IMSS-B TaxID=885319 RepID=M3TXL6_ENTH1|nr:calcineurin catalytic subunit A, putative [Entamoeba histolytica HM-1:IMSS-B]
MGYNIEIPKDDKGKYDMKKLREHFMKGGGIKETSIHEINEEVKKILKEEKNVIEVNDNGLLFGDYHGQYFDFLTQLEDKYWDKTEETKIYLGDYVDRGRMSTEIIITLFCMKINNPKKVIILRGNHETRMMTQTMGFMSECKKKYNINIYYEFCESFDYLPLGVIIKRKIGKFFCCHGGISPEIKKIEEINEINRFCEPPSKGIMCDILWSDPITEEFLNEHLDFKMYYKSIEFIPNVERNCSYKYGYKAINKFLQDNQCIAIIRGHQWVDNGVEMHYFGNNQLTFPLCFTIFGATHYSLKNKAAAMLITDTNIDISKYPASLVDNDYNPTIEHALNYSLDIIMEGIGSFINQFVYLTFTTEDIDDDSNDSNDSNNSSDDERSLSDDFCIFDCPESDESSLSSLPPILSSQFNPTQDLMNKNDTKMHQSNSSQINININDNSHDNKSFWDTTTINLFVFHYLYSLSRITNTYSLDEQHFVQKIREESIPLTLDELRAKFLELQSKTKTTLI